MVSAGGRGTGVRGRNPFDAWAVVLSADEEILGLKECSVEKQCHRIDGSGTRHLSRFRGVGHAQSGRIELVPPPIKYC